MSFEECVIQQGPIISSLVFGVMFVISEVLPLLDSCEGNGIVHEIIHLLKKARNPRDYGADENV